MAVSNEATWRVSKKKKMIFFFFFFFFFRLRSYALWLTSCRAVANRQWHHRKHYVDPIDSNGPTSTRSTPPQPQLCRAATDENENKFKSTINKKKNKIGNRTVFVVKCRCGHAEQRQSDNQRKHCEKRENFQYMLRNKNQNKTKEKEKKNVNLVILSIASLN
jgi:hypothetical protein